MFDLIIIVVISIARCLLDKGEHTALYKINQTYKYTHKPKKTTTHAHTHTHAYTHTHMHTYTHTPTHTPAHINMQEVQREDCNWDERGR